MLLYACSFSYWKQKAFFSLPFPHHPLSLGSWNLLWMNSISMWRVSLLLYYLSLTALPALISTALCNVCARSIAFDHSSVAFTFLTERLWTRLFQHYKVAPAVPRFVASRSCVWVVRGAGRGHVGPHSFWQPVLRSTELPAWLWARLPPKGAGEDEELII